MGEVTNFCCCGSNVTAVKVFAGIFMSILGIIGFIMAVIWTLWHGIHEESLERNVPFWAMSASFTFWFVLSIFVLIGANGKGSTMLTISFILAIIGILGLIFYLIVYYLYFPEGLDISEERLFWVFIGSCIKIAFSSWYTLVIFGAMKEKKNGDGSNGIVYNTPGAQMVPMQPQGYSAVPTQQPPQIVVYQNTPQVYPTAPQQ